MRLIEARIDGFGELSDRSIGLDAPVIVVYGPNEAGKSTLFGYLRTMLYGFARRSSATERHEPMRGGRHGGRLLFADAEERVHLLERYAAVAGGKPKIRLWRPDSSQGSAGELERELLLEQAVWEQRYLGGVQERLYRQLYAITLTELMEVGVLSGNELSRYLYQAGWEEGRAVAAAEKRIQSEMDELFKPRGANQRLNGHATMIEALNSELRGLQDGIERFNELTREGEAAERELAVLEMSVPGAEEHVRLLRKAVAARPLWLRRMSLFAETERLRYAEKLPSEAASSWSSLLARRAELGEEAARIRMELDQCKTKRASLTFDKTLIARGGETEAVLQSAERMRSLVIMRSEWRTELESLDEGIAKLVAGISPEWTERQLRELIVTVGDKDHVRDVRERFAGLQRNLEKMQAECETLQSQRQETALLREETSALLRLERPAESIAGTSGDYSLLDLSVPRLASAWTAVDDALRSWELERARVLAERYNGRETTNGRSQQQRHRRVSTLWGIGGIAVSAALAIGSSAGWLHVLSGGAMAAALLLGGASIALLIAGAMADGGRQAAGRTSGDVRGRRSERKLYQAAEADEAEARIVKSLALLVREPTAALTELIDRAAESIRPGARVALHSQVAAMQEHLARKERLDARLAEQDQRLARIRDILAERETTLAKLSDDASGAAMEWSEWLVAKSLPSGMSPAAALETFEVAESAMERLRQFDRQASKIAAADKELAEYANYAARLCVGFEEGLRQADRDPTLALTLLLAEASRHAGSLAEHASLQVDAANLSASLRRTEEELTAVVEEINRALAVAGVDHEPAYVAALKDRERLTELEGELTRAGIELAAGQSDERLKELEALWSTCDEVVLQMSLKDAELDAVQLADEQREWLERRGRVKQATEHLMNEEKRGELLASRAMATSALEADADRYAVLAVSRALIRATRRKFEEERQPSVIRNASDYMKRLSKGRYVRVHANGREAGIAVERADGAVTDSGLLSRGTAEQLYLSMRLALAHEATGPVNLPMLLDDLFVNFDNDRLHAAVEQMNLLAEERQLILFTCHEHVRDKLLAGCAGAKLINMTPGR